MTRPTTRPARYLVAAQRLIEVIGSDAAVAGGLAVNAYGFPRATRDVDVITSVPLTEARDRLKRRGIDCVLRKGDPMEGDFSCLQGVIGTTRRGSAGGVPFDVLPELVSISTEVVEVSGRPLRVVDLETLTRLKLKAGSIKDLYDVAILAHLHQGLRRRALVLAAADPEVARRLEGLIDDPRTAAQAREIRRQDEALARFKRRGTTKR